MSNNLSVIYQGGCPVECLFCRNGNCLYEKEFISFKDFVHRIGKIPFVSNICFKGNGFYDDEEFLKAILYARENGVCTALCTDGLIKKTKNESIKENNSFDGILNSNPALIDRFTFIPTTNFMKLKQVGLDKVVMDYDSYKKTLHDSCSIMTGSLKNTFYFSLMNAQHAGLNVLVSLSWNGRNDLELLNIIDVLAITSVKDLEIKSGIKDKTLLDIDNKKRFLNFLAKASKKFSGKIFVMIPAQENDYKDCQENLKRILIDGSVNQLYYGLTPIEYQYHGFTVYNESEDNKKKYDGRTFCYKK